MINIKELEQSTAFIDEAMNFIVATPPPEVNVMQLVTHYNKIKNVLASILKENEE